MTSWMIPWLAARPKFRVGLAFFAVYIVGYSLFTLAETFARATGFLSSILLILVSPTVMGASAIFPLENPGIVSIPLSLMVTVILSLGSEK